MCYKNDLKLTLVEHLQALITAHNKKLKVAKK
jgi:hypothetical protein